MQKSRNFGHLLEKFEQEQMVKLSDGKHIDDFRAGDRIRVVVAIYDGGQYIRDQNFEGICLRRRNRALRSSFLVRRDVNGIGLERNFPLHSNTLKAVIRTGVGKSRQATVYHVRDLSGKKLSRALGIKTVNVTKK